jgi:hypothetical protein
MVINMSFQEADITDKGSMIAAIPLCQRVLMGLAKYLEKILASFDHTSNILINFNLYCLI